MSRPRVLVVEDKLVEHVFLQQAAKGIDAELSFASRGDEAVEMVHTMRYDLIVMDLGLAGPFPEAVSDIDRGRRVYEQLRSYTNAPVMVLTGNASVPSGRRALAAMRPDAIVAKYPPIEVLQDHLRRFLKLPTHDTNAIVYHDPDPARSFVLHEADRYRAYRSMCMSMRQFQLGSSTAEWPDGVLSFVADITFSDGAAFVYPCPNGRIEIVQASAAVNGNSCPLLEGITHGELWTRWRAASPDGRATSGPAQDDQPIRENGMAAQWFEQSGLRLPDKSSIMTCPLFSRYRQAAWLCVWRVPDGGRPHSTNPYEVWDGQWCEMVAKLIGLSIDSRQHGESIARLRVLRDAARAFQSAVVGAAVGLNKDIADVNDVGLRSGLKGKVDALIAQVNHTFTELVGECSSGEMR